tara:strand:- start:340 stop:1035 length:696 start_codon:yes stop_codon:yes gene_type:complete
MKTALCFACTGRSIEYTFDNIKHNLIDDIPNCDVIVYLAKSPKSDLAKERLETLDNVKVYVEPEEDMDLSPYTFRPDWPGRANSSHQIFMNMVKSRSYMKTLIEKQNTHYDRVIFSRMDIIFEEPVNNLIRDLDLSNLWVPYFHNWGGYNDRFAVSNKENMFEYFSLFENLEDYCREGLILHAETSLKYHLDKANVDTKRFKIIFYRIRANGEITDNYDRFLEAGVHSCDA